MALTGPYVLIIGENPVRAEGLRVSLDAATSKLAQAALTAARRVEAVNLGIPAYRGIAATTLAVPETLASDR